jgi:5-methylcytosine-specific restriction endonuclease McrA
MQVLNKVSDREIKILSDVELRASSKLAVKNEITATTNVVRHFCEIYRRELYLSLGFSSMFSFAVNEYGYDKASAHRRTSAMALALRVPVVLEKIDQKLLSLQTAADIQKYLNFERGQKNPLHQKQIEDLVEVCSGLSSRQVQVELAKRNPNIDFSETKKAVSEDRVRISHTISNELEEKLERIKNLRSHVNPYMSREELLNYMADVTLAKIDLEGKVERTHAIEQKKQMAAVPAQEPQRQTDAIPVRKEVVNDVGEIQLAVRAKNNQRGCSFTSEVTGQRCGTQHQEQLDHVVEFSRGGASTADNLQVYCAKHNRYRWRQRSSSQVRACHRAYG